MRALHIFSEKYSPAYFNLPTPDLPQEKFSMSNCADRARLIIGDGEFFTLIGCISHRRARSPNPPTEFLSENSHSVKSVVAVE